MEKTTIIFLICISLASQGVNGQPGQPAKMSSGDSLRNEGDIPGAIVEYRKVFESNPSDQNNVYNFACVLSINRQVDSCFKYLEKAVELDTSVSALIDPDFLTVRMDKGWQEFEDKLISLLNNKNQGAYKDVEYAKKLWKLRALDQAFFMDIEIAGRKFGWKSSVTESLWLSKFIIGQHSQEEMDELITQKGWPRVKDVGIEAAFAAYLVIMHSNGELQAKYLPEIKKACELNEIPWVRYANIYDRCKFNENKPQKYGTHTRYNETTGKEELYPLEDASRVNEWRKELGLEPLTDYLKRYGITWP